jgi:hypothetical protein
MKNTTGTKEKVQGRKRKTIGQWQIVVVGVVMAGLVTSAAAGPREQAKRIHDRLAGVPPTEQVLQTMENQIAGGNPIAAAYMAMDNKYFYNVTLKNFAAPWTNRDQSVFVPLNDYIATVIGMIRDEEDFSTLLSADIAYVGRSGIVPSAPAATNNDHFAQLEANNVDLANINDFVRVPQSSINGIASSATAGVMTSRAAAEAFFIAGTNRAMLRFTLLNHMCYDMEQMLDTKLPPDWIRQDVSRSPGGDSRLFLNNCIGCHSGMDPLAGAYAYYNFDETSGRLEYTPGNVQPKYYNNDLNFPQGFRTVDDSWENRWRSGQNAYLGFRLAGGSGNGAKTLGQELGNSDAFAACQVRKVFKTVCLREPDQAFDAITSDFIQGGHSMKQVFADVAVHCMGQ